MSIYFIFHVISGWGLGTRKTLIDHTTPAYTVISHFSTCYNMEYTRGKA